MSDLLLGKTEHPELLGVDWSKFNFLRQIGPYRSTDRTCLQSTTPRHSVFPPASALFNEVSRVPANSGAQVRRYSTKLLSEERGVYFAGVAMCTNLCDGSDTINPIPEKVHYHVGGKKSNMYHTLRPTVTAIRVLGSSYALCIAQACHTMSAFFEGSREIRRKPPE